MMNKATYDNPPQMADYGLNEDDFHHCGDDASDNTCIDEKQADADNHVEPIKPNDNEEDG